MTHHRMSYPKMNLDHNHRFLFLTVSNDQLPIKVLYSLSQPFKFLFLVFKWMFTEVFVELSRMKFLASSSRLPFSDYDVDQDQNQDYSDTKRDEKKKVIPPKDGKAPPSKNLSEDEIWFAQEKLKPKKNETVFYPCDKKSDLYVLQQKFILHNYGHSDNGSR